MLRRSLRFLLLPKARPSSLWRSVGLSIVVTMLRPIVPAISRDLAGCFKGHQQSFLRYIGSPRFWWSQVGKARTQSTNLGESSHFTMSNSRVVMTIMARGASKGWQTVSPLLARNGLTFATHWPGIPEKFCLTLGRLLGPGLNLYSSQLGIGQRCHSSLGHPGFSRPNFAKINHSNQADFHIKLTLLLTPHSEALMAAISTLSPLDPIWMQSRWFCVKSAALLFRPLG
ncbi:uncharacterized protein VTP21DRAFT_4910 [Calcarisporiella thermophila]|uniref:uncharacterized protein n=1 Tax=Calcarisporiella thermophila TaxID=911321 RepID=UPI003743AC66